MRKRGGCGGCGVFLVLLAAAGGAFYWKAPPPTREAAVSHVRNGVQSVRERFSGKPKPPDPPPSPPSKSPYSIIPIETGGDAPGPNEARITRQEFGADWPLTVDEATVSCRENAVYLRADGVLYALDGIALKRMTKEGTKDFRASGLWVPDPSLAGFKMSLGPVIDKGLTLCR